MFDDKKFNVILVVSVMVLACGIILGAALLLWGDVLVPLFRLMAPYSYLTVLVIVLAALYFAS